MFLAILFLLFAAGLFFKTRANGNRVDRSYQPYQDYHQNYVDVEYRESD